jgi:hypothetical protein
MPKISKNCHMIETGKRGFFFARLVLHPIALFDLFFSDSFTKNKTHHRSIMGKMLAGDFAITRQDDAAFCFFLYSFATFLGVTQDSKSQKGRKLTLRNLRASSCSATHSSKAIVNKCCAHLPFGRWFSTN